MIWATLLMGCTRTIYFPPPTLTFDSWSPVETNDEAIIDSSIVITCADNDTLQASFVGKSPLERAELYLQMDGAMSSHAVPITSTTVDSHLFGLVMDASPYCADGAGPLSFGLRVWQREELEDCLVGGDDPAAVGLLLESTDPQTQAIGCRISLTAG